MNDKPIKVLLVEDNPGDACLLREALAQRHGARFDLAHVKRLTEALERIRSERFEIALLDLSLPDAQGLDTVVGLHKQAPDVPIVVLTGLDDETVAGEALREGAQDYLVKGQIDGELLARAMRYAIERSRAEARIQRQLERITALRAIDVAISSTLDLQAILGILLAKLDFLLPHEAVTVRLFDRDTGKLEPAACRNLDEKRWRSRKEAHGFCKIVFDTMTPLMIRNIQKDERTLDLDQIRDMGLRSYLGLPLIVKGKALGVLSFYAKNEREFTKEEVDFLSTVAGQAALAIHNSILYEERAKLASDLARASRGKDEFLSVMSHELRTPLTAIVGYTEMMRDRMFGEITPEQEKALEKVMARSKDLLVMINGILQVTQLEADAVKVEACEVGLKSFLDDLRLSYGLPLGKELKIIWDYPARLPVLKTDADKLRHILQNLINNAIKFTERGSVSISARYRTGKGEVKENGHRSETNGHGIMEFKVADTGVGIPKEMIPVIFEMFRQVDSSDTRLYGGVGLGLYIVKKYVDALGGNIEVESEIGRGSVFELAIPCEASSPSRLCLSAASPGGVSTK